MQNIKNLGKLYKTTKVLYMPNLKEKVLQHVENTGIVRSREIRELGAPAYYLNLLEKEGKIQKLGRGIYAKNSYEFDENQGYIEVSKRAPNAILCLLSALRFYELTTQNPHSIWIAIGNKDWKPKIEYPPIRVLRASGKALSEGIEIIEKQGVKIRVYCPAKTIADCFKHRKKVGMDVALEALQEGWKKQRFTLKELNHYAKICHVQKRIKPYIDSLLQPS